MQCIVKVKVCCMIVCTDTQSAVPRLRVVVTLVTTVTVPAQPRLTSSYNN